MEKITANDPEARSADLVADNIARLKALFPELVTEGKDGAAVNVDVLKQLVGDATVADAEEKYGLNWHGKRRARQLALTPSLGTLRPCPEDSVDWDTTQNLMIEGDNLEVLKLLQKSYAGKVKLIYIDPPYNTGRDFVYPDNFHDTIGDYLRITGQVEGERRVSSNTEASGRFHTDWLSMMFPRLRVARDLLRDDGLIFISINDVEVANLRSILNEIFGEGNFEGHIHWRRRHNQPNDRTKMIGQVAEHIICYAKDSGAYKRAGVGKVPLTGNFANPDNDPRGDWASKPWKVGSDQSGSRYVITTPAGKRFDEQWMGDEENFKSLLEDGRIFFPDNGNGPPRKKYFRSEREAEGQCATNWWSHELFGHNQGANYLLAELFGVKNVFSNPKPIELLSGIISIANVKSEDIVMDFFAGSGTTAHAVLASNAEDGLGRRFITVQLPETLDITDSDQRVAAEVCDSLGRPRNIAELTKERVRRAGAKVRREYPRWSGDSGFRVYKLDHSNIRAWHSTGDLESDLVDSIEHILPDRSEHDVLTELLLKLGLDLCVPIEQREIAGSTVHAIGGGVLMASLDGKIGRDDAEPLALGIADWHRELDPVGDTTCVFRDSAFENDEAKTNLAAILEQHGIHHVRSL